MTKLFNPKLLLAVVACLTCGLAASAYSFKVNGVYYNFTGSSYVEVTSDIPFNEDWIPEDWTPSTLPNELTESASSTVAMFTFPKPLHTTARPTRSVA